MKFLSIYLGWAIWCSRMLVTSLWASMVELYHGGFNFGFQSSNETPLMIYDGEPFSDDAVPVAY